MQYIIVCLINPKYWIGNRIMVQIIDNYLIINQLFELYVYQYVFVFQ